MSREAQALALGEKTGTKLGDLSRLQRVGSKRKLVQICTNCSVLFLFLVKH